jgi:glycosyltransferase involved in cell wall biosynthesis
MMSQSSPYDSLTIVIPALNEEDAIASIIERCLAARDAIKAAAGLELVEVIVVSDGSTDRTAEIARTYDEVKVIVFERNRGYGAAIKEGFRQGGGDLVGFIDADGTCDPLNFADMCRAIVEDEADIALGSRMGPGSKMPAVRRLGNRIFAAMLGLLCGQQVVDTASGMRVLRRSVLGLLYPLPDRLHFTPSMSARAMINGLRVAEIPMSYEERIGRSKLRVLEDGVRFFRTIIEGVLCYRPERLFMMGFSACLIISLVLGLYPLEFYARHRRVEEWMIYRFVTCFLLGACGFLLVCAAVLSHRMSALGPRRRSPASFWTGVASYLFDGRILAAFVVAVLAGSLALLWPGIVEFITTSRITLHWSRVMVGLFGLLLVFQALVTKVMIEVVNLWQYQRGAAGELAQAKSPAAPVGEPLGSMRAVAGRG